MTVFPRFRAPDRDRQTDIERMSSVHVELRAVLLAIEREREGLSRRLEQFRSRAGALLGCEDGIYFQREPGQEVILVEAERQMEQTSARLRTLQAQHGLVADMLDRFNISLTSFGLKDVCTNPIRRRPKSTAYFSARWLFQTFGMALILFLVYASVLPVEYRPVVPGMAPDVDRFIAYLVTALLLGAGFPQHRARILIFGLSLVAGLELAQLWVVSRDASLSDAVIKAFGFTTGIVASTFMVRLVPRLRTR